MPVTIVPHGSLKKSGSSKSSKSQRSAQDMIDFSAKHIKDLETSIAQHMVEENEYWVVHQKPAFREMIDEAISFGANVGVGVYKHCGKKRMRVDLIPGAVDSMANSTEMIPRSRHLVRRSSQMAKMTSARII